MESRRLNRIESLLLVCMSLLSLAVGCDDGDAEAGVDAGTNVVMAGVDPFCDTRPQYDFCEDFDTQALPGSFDEQIIEGGELIITDEDASSLPRSLKVTVESGQTAALRHQFQAGGKIRLFGMLYVSELGDGDVEIGAFEAGDYRVGFGVRSDGHLWAHEDGEQLAAEGTIPVGRWASFRWDVNLYADGTGSAKLRFGNDYIVNTEMLMRPMASEVLPAATVGLSDATGPWTMRFDNLTVSVKELDE